MEGNSVEKIADLLQQRGVRLVACTMVDNAGVARVKGVPIGKLKHVARFGVGISSLFAVFAVDDHITASSGFDTPSGDMRLIPDLSAAVVLASATGWAWAPVDQYDQELQLMPVCQRGLLRRLTEDAAAQGITFQMAYELEFTLFDADGEPAHEGPSYSPRAFLSVEKFAVDLVDALESQGITVEQLHPEYSAGQYEISVAARPPVQAADQHVLLRLTIRQLARQYGYQVSFAPVAIRGAVGNGCHLHFSAWKDGRNLFTGGTGRENLTEEGEALVAGVLDHLLELMAILAPSVPSYERLKPQHWSGAFTCWGWENREAALRLVKGTAGTRGRAANFELKSIDGASNPYLTAAVVIASALDGLERGLRLPEPIQVDPALLSEEARSSKGIYQLPADLGEAIDELERSTFVRSTLGDPLFEAFLAVRRLEWDTYREMDMGEVVDAHRWRYG